MDQSARKLPRRAHEVHPDEELSEEIWPVWNPRRAAPRGSSRGSLRRSLLLTVASAVIPGIGLLGTSNRLARTVGVVVPLTVVGGLFWVAVSAAIDLGRFAGFSGNTSQLATLRTVLLLFALFWVVLVLVTHLMTRPAGMTSTRKLIGAVLVGVLSLGIFGPLAVASRYTFDQQQLVETIFADEGDIQSTSRPTVDHEAANPWEKIPRLNILLLGGDGAESRDASLGIRTDTIMVASIDTHSGNTTLIQIPRNVQYAPFPAGSEMAQEFPDGFRGEGSTGEFLINNVWNHVEAGRPDLFRGQTYRGAEALKQAVQGITGLKIAYFVLLNIDGLRELIDAMGGVTVNINQRLPIGGDTSGRPPTGWLEQGPDQHLDGHHAMWYARSRSTTSDYDRMARQSCLIDAIIKQASPSTMLTSYEAIARASSDMVMTDIPRQALEPLIDLSLDVKDATIERLVFTPGKNGYDYNNPDFAEMRRSVDDAIKPSPDTADPAPTGESTSSAPATPEGTQSADQTPADPDDTASTSAPVLVDGAQEVTDACAYNPVP